MSLVFGLFISCGWVMLTDRQPHTVTVLFTAWALSSIIAYCFIGGTDHDTDD